MEHLSKNAKEEAELQFRCAKLNSVPSLYQQVYDRLYKGYDKQGYSQVWLNAFSKRFKELAGLK